MDIVDPITHRVLAYIEAVNRHGVRPSTSEIGEFAANPDRREPRSSGMGALSLYPGLAHAVSALDFLDRTIPGETFTRYLQRLGWIVVDAEDGVRVSDLGQALLRALNAPVLDGPSDVFEVVLDPGDPFAYVRAMQRLTDVADAMLVDPYFGVQELIDLHTLSNVTRILIGPKPARRDSEALGRALAVVSHPLELRHAKDLHDRYLIPRGTGSVVMLGTSINGIGKKVSTITSLAGPASQALRDLHEGIWGTATRIEPHTPPDLPDTVPPESKQSDPS